MRLLALDPGAKRLGWAVLEDGKYVDSGIWSCLREDGEPYQAYRLRLIEEASLWMRSCLILHEPDALVSEIVPVKGFNDMGQSILAMTAVTAMQSICIDMGVPINQIGATTVKKEIGGTAKASKVGVRNGVWEILPELVSKRAEWKGVYDESDAIAIGLAYSGFKRLPK